MGFGDEILTYVPALRRYSRALMTNRELADDLVQDTLERALQNTSRFAAGTDLRAWLFTIMHNMFVNQLRKLSARTPHCPVDDEILLDVAFATPANNLPRLELRDLAVALEQLPAEQREVVLLVGLEDMSYADVARALTIPVGTVMSRLSRGRNRLRELMAGEQTQKTWRTTSANARHQVVPCHSERTRIADGPRTHTNFAFSEMRKAELASVA